jgi:hypothetical protein
MIVAPYSFRLRRAAMPHSAAPGASSNSTSSGGRDSCCDGDRARDDAARSRRPGLSVPDHIRGGSGGQAGSRAAGRPIEPRVAGGPAAPAHPNALHVVGTGGAGATLREQPSTTAKVLATLPDGSEVEPLEGPIEGDGLLWMKVRSTTEQQGWVAADLLQATAHGSEPLAGPIPADGLSWRKVRAEGNGGWIVSTYVRLS